MDKTNKTDIKSLTKAELSDELKQFDFPSFRVDQIYDWLHIKFADSFDEMTNVSKDMRKLLAEYFEIKTVKIAKKLVSEIDSTRKYLFELNDGEYIESVLMKYKYGYSICVSTQVGCNMGCKFCASTLNGCVRSLEPSEILSQLYAASKDISQRISHIVLMGMGEPLDNFDNVLKFIELVTNKDGVNLSARNITLSTCGIVPKIKLLADMNLPITLSVSLHAPVDELRSKTMPVNNKWGIDEVLAACKDYANKTSRRVSFEYAMIKGVNDSAECAEQLAGLLSGMLAHVNLIPVNNVEENSFIRSDDSSIKEFENILKSKHIAVTVRRTLGADINASCGQLRRSNQNKRR